MTAWLTRTQAAQRVGRTERTIRKWVADGDVVELAGRISESDLIATDRTKRAARAKGRPRRTEGDPR